LTLFIKINHFSHYVVLDLLVSDELLLFITFNFLKHLFKAQKIERSLFEGELDHFKHDDKEMVQWTFMIVGKFTQLLFNLLKLFREY
jgi:hypothetical protein